MRVIGIIPARYHSSRFPGKPLALLGNRPMIEWVYKRALASNVDELYVATDHAEIESCVKQFGGKVIMTRSDHETGSDRLFEAASKIAPALLDNDIIINIQGDEPLIELELINALVEVMKSETAPMATLKHEIVSDEELENPNVVKVITNQLGNAIYFSRFPIPYRRGSISLKNYRHIGIYAYRYQFLKEYVKLSPSLLEQAESLEQLRVLDSGFSIKVVEVATSPSGVDTPEDLRRLEEYIRKHQMTLS